MRNYLDPKRFYKKEKKNTPTYFQVNKAKQLNYKIKKSFHFYFSFDVFEIATFLC
jgi:hypothetical protein